MSIADFSQYVGVTLAHRNKDVLWVPHKTNPRDAKGSRVRQNQPFIKDLTENQDYFKIEAFNPQKGDRFMITGRSGTHQVELWTVRIPCDLPAFRADNAVFITTFNVDVKIRIQDVLVFDYETHNKRAKAYEVKKIHDDCRYSKMLRLEVVEMGIFDTEFIGSQI